MTYLWTLLKCICKIRCVTYLCMMVRIELRTTIHETCLIIKNENLKAFHMTKSPPSSFQQPIICFACSAGHPFENFMIKNALTLSYVSRFWFFGMSFPFAFLWSKIISEKPFGAKMRLCSCIQFHSSTDQNSGHNCHNYYESEHLMLPKIGTP